MGRSNQIDRASAGWAYRIRQADLRDVREADGFRWCTDSEVYPLNLMLFTGLDYPRDGTAADPLAD